MIRHIVMFSAQSASRDRILRGLLPLEKIPHALRCEVRENLRIDDLSKEIDVVVYAEFSDENMLAKFKTHPIYHEAIINVRPHRSLRIVADYEA